MVQLVQSLVQTYAKDELFELIKKRILITLLSTGSSYHTVYERTFIIRIKFVLNVLFMYKKMQTKMNPSNAFCLRTMFHFTFKGFWTMFWEHCSIFFKQKDRKFRIKKFEHFACIRPRLFIQVFVSTWIGVQLLMLNNVLI